MTPPRKRCTRCRRWREHWQFYRLARGGHRAECSDCTRRQARERMRRHMAKAASVILQPTPNTDKDNNQ